MTVRETLESILQEKLDIPAEKLTDNASFDSLDINSIDMIELICEVEDRLDIDFGEPFEIANYGQLVSYLESLVS